MASIPFHAAISGEYCTIYSEQGSRSLSTANLDEADRTARVGLMHRGSIIQLGNPRELKGLVKGFMVELVSSDLAASRRALAEIPEVLDFNVFGDGLHVRLSEEQGIEAIRDRFHEQGLRISSLRSIVPSMDDAFLSLIPREQGGVQGS